MAMELNCATSSAPTDLGEQHDQARRADHEDAAKDDFTKITFQPDLKRFGMQELEDDIISLMCRRAFDIAGTSRFKAYVDRYIKDVTDDSGEPLKVAFEQVNNRWEIAMAVSDRGFQQISFVNSIATAKGGRHVDYVAEQIVAQLIETVKKKIESHVGVCQCADRESTFDSQTKETMTLQAKSFGSVCKCFGEVCKERLTSLELLSQSCPGSALNKPSNWTRNVVLRRVPRSREFQSLKMPNDAGSKSSHLCTLILTEGDSAKSLAVGWSWCSHKQIMENVEINAMLKIIGLQYK
uniref:DNA topoisomerase 2 n=1 Tax=Ditylenchus dipsaci TaxID=166011 RepID=A0A915DLI9_9BILA